MARAAAAMMMAYEKKDGAIKRMDGNSIAMHRSMRTWEVARHPGPMVSRWNIWLRAAKMPTLHA